MSNCPACCVLPFFESDYLPDPGIASGLFGVKIYNVLPRTHMQDVPRLCLDRCDICTVHIKLTVGRFIENSAHSIIHPSYAFLPHIHQIPLHVSSARQANPHTPAPQRHLVQVLPRELHVHFYQTIVVSRSAGCFGCYVTCPNAVSSRVIHLVFHRHQHNCSSSLDSIKLVYQHPLERPSAATDNCLDSDSSSPKLPQKIGSHYHPL
jgi:hypothetical protein